MDNEARLAKLEIAVKAALRLRRVMVDLGPMHIMLDVPREEVIKFDNVIKELKNDDKTGSN